MIDSDYVSSNGACCGALCRLIAWSEGKRMAILVRLKRALLHDQTFLMRKEASNCLTLHRQPCRACPISATLTPHLEIICRDSQNLYLVVNGTPPPADPKLTQDNLLSGPSLREPLTTKFDLPEPAAFPRPHCGTPLPDVTEEFVSNYHSTPQEKAPVSRPLRRSTRHRK